MRAQGRGEVSRHPVRRSHRGCGVHAPGDASRAARCVAAAESLRRHPLRMRSAASYHPRRSSMPPDTIAAAVLAREDVARFLEGSHGLSSAAARTKVLAYLDELQTTQRYELYRALEYPLYPILRK